jgi:hypothetical protein
MIGIVLVSFGPQTDPARSILMDAQRKRFRAVPPAFQPPFMAALDFAVSSAGPPLLQRSLCRGGGPSVFPRQKALTVAWQKEIGTRMPFWCIQRSRWLFVFRLLRRSLDSNGIAGITDHASQHPKHRTNHENDILLCSRQIPTDNVGDSDRAASYAHVEPPKDPTMYPDVNMHELSQYVGCPVAPIGCSCPCKSFKSSPIASRERCNQR